MGKNKKSNINTTQSDNITITNTSTTYEINPELASFTISQGSSSNVMYNSTITSGPLRDKSGYVTSDQFFDLLKQSFDDSYGCDYDWHPQDIYLNVLSVLESVTGTLSNIMRLRNGLCTESIKEK